MTFQYKPIPINQLGWLYVKLDKEVMDFLWKMINKSTKDNMKSNLAGNISKSYSLEDDENYFFNNVLLPLTNHWVNNNGTFSAVPCAENLDYYLHQFWVNYQNQYEVNPCHDHAGLFSFAIWMKIPYDCKEQNKLPEEKGDNKYFWQKPHQENKTGTQKSYKPNKISKKGKDFKKYETWKH